MPENEAAGSDQELATSSASTVDQQGEGSAGAGQAVDSYEDLRADPRVQKYVSDLHSKAVQHIPKEFRERDQFGRLLQSHRQWEQLQKDPGYQAFQAGRQNSQGGQQAQKSPFHAKILEALESDFGPMDGQRKKFLGRMIDGIADALESRVAETHVKPIADHLGQQSIAAELDQVKKMDRYSDVRDDMREILEKHDYRISFDTAYKLAMYNLTDKERKALKAGAGSEGGEGDPGEKPVKRPTSGERPTGSGAGDLKAGNIKSAKAAQDAAMRALRAKGIL